MITTKKQELIKLLKDILPTAPAEIAQKNITWYKSWEINENLIVGDRRAYNNILYEAIQAHTTQEGWEPPQVPALFKQVWIEEYPEWIQPTGAQDAYMKNDKVSYNDKKWASDVDNNVWEPGVYGWSEINL